MQGGDIQKIIYKGGEDILKKGLTGRNYLKSTDNNLVHGEWISVKRIRLIRQ